ncbi:HRDC domain-containing protein [Desulfuromonas sp. DDH964]|uniref:HRDC domain-containing protein n=1 Tax=Desulfuromonas sp. DDH964 TaxID=1823759 RepID=UPI0018D37515|nr:HRDC domain-containing protein [Desulfuromonas sp. DDH964]
MQQWQFFRVPVNNGAEAAAEFNRFLRGARVLAVHREFVVQGESSYWALAVEFLSEGGVAARRESGKRNKVDWREVLSPEDFALYARLREWRKKVAEEEAVPVYTIFTNEQLAEVAQRRCASAAALAEIDGIGKGRIERYGNNLLAVLNEAGR